MAAPAIIFNGLYVVSLNRQPLHISRIICATAGERNDVVDLVAVAASVSKASTWTRVRFTEVLDLRRAALDLAILVPYWVTGVSKGGQGE